MVYRVRPSQANPAVQRFDLPHYIVSRSDEKPAAPLFVFLSGTRGKPGNVKDLCAVVAEQGYRVISLAYNDAPAVLQVCPKVPNPQCSARFRQKRMFGTDSTLLIDDRPEESIAGRLADLLKYLDRAHPQEGWGGYLDRGQPNWPRIALSGHSQGAGMAAFAARQCKLARVVLFSSPWDYYGRPKELAPWIDGAGATPAQLWFGTYHEKERAAALIAQAYKRLQIPADHVRVLTLEPARKLGANPYHATLVGDLGTPRLADGSPAYAPVWRFLVGSPAHP